jgi:hypothetical protein
MVDGGTSPNGQSDTDDNLSQVLESAMDMLSAVIANPPMQAHSPGSGDDQHTDNQKTHPPSASPAREESDAASERGSPNTRTSSQPTIQLTPSNNSRSSITPTRTTLSPADMDGLVPKLAELERQGSGQHVIVPRHDNIGLADIQSAIKTGDWQYKSIHYKEGPNGKGDTRVYVSEREPLMDWSGFTKEIKRPTTEEAKAIFENATQKPPEGDISYYVGHADLPPGKPLDPGSFITGNPHLKDLYTPYNHIGGPGSANRIHHEDKTYAGKTSEGPRSYGLRSFNEVYFGSGYKLWLVIMKHHIAKFNAFIRANWKCKRCDHGVSHLCLLVAPSTLEREGIDYEIAVVGRGEAFWTFPGQPHQVINFGYCAARSINFSHPEDNLDINKANECAECGFHRQKTASGKGHKRKAPKEPLEAAPGKTRAYAVASEVLNKTRKLIRAAAPLFNPPQHPSLEETHVMRMAAAILSTHATDQFKSLVIAWRDRNEHTVISSGTGHDQLTQCAAYLKNATSKTAIGRFQLRHSRALLARLVDDQKTKRSISLLTSEEKTELAKRLNMEINQLSNVLREGRMWNNITGEFPGMLAFIPLNAGPPFNLSVQDWKRLDKAQLKVFHSLIDCDTLRELCKAGAILQDIVARGSNSVFKWEQGSHHSNSQSLWETLEPIAD